MLKIAVLAMISIVIAIASYVINVALREDRK
jgi:hypothetical protein